MTTYTVTLKFESKLDEGQVEELFEEILTNTRGLHLMDSETVNLESVVATSTSNS